MCNTYGRTKAKRVAPSYAYKNRTYLKSILSVIPISMNTRRALDTVERPVIHNVSLDDPLVLWQFTVMPFEMLLNFTRSPHILLMSDLHSTNPQ